MLRAIQVLGLLMVLIAVGAGIVLWSPAPQAELIPLAPDAGTMASNPRNLIASGDSSAGAESSQAEHTGITTPEGTALGITRSSEGAGWSYIKGAVRSKSTQFSIPGATVTITDGEGRTAQGESDEDGTFEIEWLGADQLALVLTAEGFEERKHPGIGWQGEPFELEMIPMGVVIGTFERLTEVLEPPYGEVRFYRGSLNQSNRKPDHVVPLDREPQFRAWLPAGTWSLSLHRPAQSTSFESGFEVRMGEETLLQLPLSSALVYRGQVVFKRGNVGVPGITLELRQQVTGISRGLSKSLGMTCITDAEGRFSFEGLAACELIVEGWTPWGQPVGGPFALTHQNSEREQRLVVAPPGRISGFVRDFSGQPSADVMVALVPKAHLKRSGLSEVSEEDVRAKSEMAGLTQKVTTDEIGRFLFEQAPSNRPVLLQVRTGPFLVAEASVQVAEGQVLEGVTITLASTNSFGVCVRDPEGQFVAGVRVTLWRPDGSARLPSGFRPRVVTDDQGLAHFPFAANDMSLATVSGEGWLRGEGLLVHGGVTQITLEPAAVVRGFVRDLDGWEVPNLLVTAKEPGEERKGRSRRTFAGSDGSFEIADFAGGQVTLMASGKGWEQVEPRNVLLLPGQPQEVILTVQRTLRQDPGSLRVEAVARGSGAPVEGLVVLGTGPCISSLVGPELIVTGIRPGRYTPTLRAPGFEQLRLSPLDVLGGEILNLGRFELRRASDVQVIVLDTNGKPVSRARVVLSERSEDPDQQKKLLRWKGRTDEKGRLTLKRVPRESLRLTVSHSSFKKFSEVQRIKGSKEPLRVRLKSRNR